MCLFYLHRIPLIRFKSIKKQLKEKGELEEFWKNHHPDVFARRYLHCFPADIALSVGTASERLYDYMNVSTVLVMESLGLIVLLKAGFFPSTFQIYSVNEIIGLEVSRCFML